MDFNESNELGNQMTLLNESGKEFKFELLDILNHNEKIYLVAVPEEFQDKVIFLEVQSDFEDADFVIVINEEFCEELFELFKERNKDVLKEK